MENSHSRVGQEIEAYCGKCRMDRTHRVVAQDADGTIRKIICAMCQSYRHYRPPQMGQTTTRRTSVRTASAPEDFGPPSRVYNMRENYQVGEVLSHPQFGIGKVVVLRDANKIEVKFPDGVKLLLQNK
ncbi:MAG: hypothetical protein AB1489_16665 [Acidobacteriota bacterium]